MKTWKCPHCKKIENSEDDIEMFLCPDCVDCNMEELLTMKRFLNSEKPEDFKGFDKQGKQVCMRCGKYYAKAKELFCESCIRIRKEIDENIKGISKINEERKNKVVVKGKPQNQPLF